MIITQSREAAEEGTGKAAAELRSLGGAGQRRLLQRRPRARRPRWQPRPCRCFPMAASVMPSSLQFTVTASGCECRAGTYPMQCLFPSSRPYGKVSLSPECSVARRAGTSADTGAAGDTGGFETQSVEPRKRWLQSTSVQLDFKLQVGCWRKTEHRYHDFWGRPVSIALTALGNQCAACNT